MIEGAWRIPRLCPRQGRTSPPGKFPASRPGLGAARLIAWVWTAAGLVSAPAAADAEKQAVIAAMQTWEKAVEAGDYARLEEHYMPEAIYYPHDSPPLIGRDAIMAHNRARGEAAQVVIEQRVDDVEVHGDWAIYSCVARVAVVSPAGGETAVRHVRVLLIMQKDADGRWKILRDIDNGTPERIEADPASA